MLQRREILFKGLSCLAGLVLLYQVGHLVWNLNPLSKVRIPQLPALTNAPASDAAAVPSTKSAGGKPVVTNASALANTKSGASNSAVATNAVVPTNAVLSAKVPTLIPGTNSGKTGVVAVASSTVRMTNSGSVKSDAGRERVSAQVASSNATTAEVAGKAAGSNALSASAASKSPTNSSAQLRPSPGATAGMNPAMGRPAPVELPKDVKARVDRVIDSEILAPVMRPLPMALLGIIGNEVILRTATGQTGLIKEGASLGGIKLTKIGINRVLIEEEGQTKELTIFSGMGGDSLMPNVKTNR